MFSPAPVSSFSACCGTCAARRKLRPRLALLHRKPCSRRLAPVETGGYLAPAPASVHTLVTIPELHRDVASFGQPLLHDWDNDLKTTAQIGPRNSRVGRIGEPGDGAAGLSGVPIP